MSIFDGKRILVVVAHADDETLQFGGLLHKYRETAEIHVLVLTNKYDVWRRDFATEQLVVQATERVKKILGIRQYMFGGLREGFVDKVLYEPIHCIEHELDDLIRQLSSRFSLDGPQYLTRHLFAPLILIQMTIRSIAHYAVNRDRMHSILKRQLIH